MKRMKETIGRLAAGSLRWAALAVAIGLAGSTWAAMEFTDPTYTPWDGVYGAVAWRSDGGNFEVSKVADIAADGTIGEPYAMKWDTAVATSGRRFCSACTSSSWYPGYTPPGMLLVYDQTGKTAAANATFNPLSFCGLWVKALADETTPYSVTGSGTRDTEFGVAGVSSYFKFDKSFTVNRTGTTTFLGEATVEIAQDATFTAQANSSHVVAVDSAATLKLKGSGTLAVTTMSVAGTLDFTETTRPTIDGDVVLAGTIVLPEGTEVSQESPFTVCSGTLSGLNVTVKIGDAEAVEKSFTAVNGAITSFGDPIYIFYDNYPTVVPAGQTYTFVGGDSAENTVVVDALDVKGTLKTQGYFSFTNYKSNGSTLDVESGSLTLHPGNNWFNGTLTVEAGATFVNGMTDAVQYGGSFTANIYGTLAMGDTRWSLGGNNTINLYEGCTVTGTGSNSGYSAFDWIENANATLNVYGDVNLAAPIRVRATATVNVNVDTTDQKGLTLAGTVGAGKIVKKGAGLLKFTTNPPYAITVENGAFTFAVDATPTITYSAKPGSGTTMSVWYATQDTWKGTIVLGVLSAPAALPLNSYGNANSKVVMKGTTGSCYLSAGTINPELVIDTDEDNVVEFNNGSSGQVVNFTKISGAGTLKLTGWTGCSEATYNINTFDNFTGTLAINNAITRNGGGTFTIGIGNIVTTGATTPGSNVLNLTQTAVANATGTVVYNFDNAQLNGAAAELEVRTDGIYVKNRVTVPAVEHATVSVVVDGVEVGTSAGDYFVAYGSDVTVTYTAAEGYLFGGDVATKTVSFDDVSENKAVTAEDVGTTSAVVAKIMPAETPYSSSVEAAVLAAYNDILAGTAYVQVIDDTGVENAYGAYGIGYDATAKKFAKAVATIGTAGYLTAQEALDVATSGATVILAGDNSEELTLANGKTVTIKAKQGPTTYTYTAPVAEDDTYTVDAADAVDGDNNPIAGAKTYTARNWYGWAVTVVAPNASVAGVGETVSEATPTVQFTVTAAADYKVTSVTVGEDAVVADGEGKYSYTFDGPATITVATALDEVTFTLPVVTGAKVVGVTGGTWDEVNGTITAIVGHTVTLTWDADGAYVVSGTKSQTIAVTGGMTEAPAPAAEVVTSTAAVAQDSEGTYYPTEDGGLSWLFGNLSTEGAYVQLLGDTTGSNVYGDYGIGYDATSKRYAKAVATIATDTIGQAAGYLTVQAALDAATSGATVTLKANSEEALTLANEKTVTIKAKQGQTTYDFTAPVAADDTYTVDAGETVEGSTTYTARDWYSWAVTVVAPNATVAGVGETVSEATPTVQFTVTPDADYKVTSVTVGEDAVVADGEGKYSYTFDGPATITVATELDVATVTFFNEDGTDTLQSSDVLIGTVPVFSGSTEKDATAQYTYTFKGWATTQGGAALETLPAVTASGATYYAVYTATVNNYVVSVPAVANATIEAVTANGETAVAVTGGYSVPYGATVVVTYAPAAGYHLASGALEVTYTNVTGAGELSGQTLPSTALTVAKIGDNCYASLAAALDAAVAGDTVTLLANVSATAQVVVSKAITLDGGNHTLTTTADWAINVHNVDNATVTIKDLTVTPGSATERFVSVEECANLTLNITGCDMQGCTYYAVNVRGSNTGLALNIDDTTLSGYCALNFWGDSGTVTVTDSTLVGVNNSPYSLNNNEFGVIVCNEYNANQPGYAISVSNTTLRAVSNIVTQGKRNDQYILLYNPNTKGNTIRLTDCTVEHGEGDAATYAFIHEEPGTSGNTTYLKNVTFAGEAVELPEGYAYSAPDADGYRQVVSAVAAVNGTGYATLAEAVAQTTSGTITLLKDCVGEGIFVGENAGKVITINFGEYTYTVASPVGSSTTVNQMLHFEAGNTITLKNGKIKVTDDSEKLAAFQMVMQNYCNLTIDGMEIDGTGIAIAKYGTFSGKWAVFNNTDKPQFNYNGSGESVIRNSTIIVPGDISIDEEAGLAIRGNTVINANGIATKGTDERFASVNPVVEISGGTFSFPVPAACCAAGYEPKDNGDDTYGVQTAKVEVETDEDDPTPTANEPVTVLVAVPKDCTAATLIDVENRAVGDILKAYVKGDDRFYTWELDSTGAWQPRETYKKVNDESSATVSTKPADQVALVAGQSVWVTIKTDETIKLLVTYNPEPVAVEVDTGWNMVAPTTPGGTTVKEIAETSGATVEDAIVVPTKAAPKVYTKDETTGEWGFADIKEVVVETVTGTKKRAIPFHNTADTTIKAGKGVWFVNGGNTKEINL